MSEIMAALTRSEKTGRSGLVLVSIIFFMPFASVIPALVTGSAQEDGLLLPYIYVLVVFFPFWFIPAYMIVQTFIRSKNPEKSKAWKRLQASGYLGMFVSTIDNELVDPATVNYLGEDKKRVLFFSLTPSWIVFISSRGNAVIHRRSELMQVSLSLANFHHQSTSNRKRINLYFAEGFKFSTARESEEVARIMEILQQELPHVKYVR